MLAIQKENQVPSPMKRRAVRTPQSVKKFKHRSKKPEADEEGNAAGSSTHQTPAIRVNTTESNSAQMSDIETEHLLQSGIFSAVLLHSMQIRPFIENISNDEFISAIHPMIAIAQSPEIATRSAIFRIENDDLVPPTTVNQVRSQQVHWNADSATKACKQLGYGRRLTAVELHALRRIVCINEYVRLFLLDNFLSHRAEIAEFLARLPNSAQSKPPKTVAPTKLQCDICMIPKRAQIDFEIRGFAYDRAQLAAFADATIELRIIRTCKDCFKIAQLYHRVCHAFHGQVIQTKRAMSRFFQRNKTEIADIEKFIHLQIDGADEESFWTELRESWNEAATLTI